MTTEILDRTYTLQEFFELDLPEDALYELIEGKPAATKNPGPGAPHGKLLIKLGGRLESFSQSQATALGTVYGECACYLELANTYVVPDLAFIASERIPLGGFSGALTVCPDLIAEINSPTDDVQKIHDKIEAYLNAGVRLVWSIYLLDKHIIVYRPGQRKQFLDLDSELAGLEVLPGFKMPVRQLFD